MADSFLVRFELDVSSAISNANRLSKSLGEVNYALGATGKAGEGLEKTLGGQAAATGRAAAGNDKLGQSLNSTRYALYDVSQTLALAGTALVGITSLTYGASIAFERDFANVIRTSQVTGDAVDTLRGNFIALQQSIPVSSSDLATIGTLGAQLGVTAENLTAFTRTTAQFAATAEVSVDVAATAFGRLDALLPGVRGNYEALASAILKTGVNSVATEAQIIKTAQQIASISTVVGLSTEEVIGLSSALASLGIPPELSRSVITSTFTKFISAAAGGSEAAEKFGKVLGITGEQFRTSFQEDALGTFRSLLKVINEQGTEGAITLDSLGLASQRLTPTLLKLAQNDDILAAALKDSAEGLNNNVELQRQYNVIAGTVAAKLQVLANNFQALTVAVGGTGGVFGGLLDIINDVLKGLTEAASNPIANFFLQTAVLGTGLIGVLALIGAGVARTAASLLALGAAFNITTVSSTGARLGLAAILTQLTSTTGGAIATTLAVNGLGLALKGLAIVAIGVTLGVILNDLAKLATDANGATVATEELGVRLAGAADSAKIFNEEIGRRGSVFAQFEDISFDDVKAALKDLGNINDGTTRLITAGWDVTAGNVMGNVDQIDDSLAQLAQSGNYALAIERAKEFQEYYDLSDVQTENLLDDFYKQVALAAEGAGTSVDEFAQSETEASLATELLAEKVAGAAAALGLGDEAFDQFAKNVQSGSAAFGGFEAALTTVDAQVRKSAELQAAATTDTSDSWEQYAEGVALDLNKVGEELDKQLAAQSSWADNIGIIAARGGGALASELAKIGPAGAEAAAALATSTEPEFQRFEARAQAAAFYASKQFADQFTQNTPALIAAYQAGGDKAVQGLIDAQIEEARSGVPGAVAEFVNLWNSSYGNNPINLQVGADAGPAQNSISGFINGWNGRRITIYVDAAGGDPVYQVGGGGGGGVVRFYADGGHVRGKGTATSDSIPARLSDGEYVVRAAAVRKYGTGMFDALNRGVAKFASGGQVGAPREVISHASPADRAIMRSQGGNRTIQLVIDGRVLATAVDNANANDQFNGSN